MKSPAFRFYPADFMGSPDVQAMDLHEVGAYMYLLCMAWQSERHGYLPDDDEKLRRWARMNREQWAQSRDLLLSKFPVVEPGWRANSRMVHEAEKQAAFSETQSAKGKLGGRPKKAEIKPELSEEKLEPPFSKAAEKPSVSVSAFVSAFDSASGEQDKDKNIPAPVEPPDAALSGNDGKRPQLVSIDQKRTGKRKASQDTGKPYDLRFEAAYELYPKHEEKSQSEIQWQSAISRLIAGERDKPPMTEVDAMSFLSEAAGAYATKMRGTETKYIRSMRKWLLHQDYLDYSPKPKTVYREMTEEEASAAWKRDFGAM